MLCRPPANEPGDCLLRKLAAALLAVPILALFYIPVLVRRSNAARIGLAIGVGGLVGLGALGLLRPLGTTATKPLPPIVPLSQAEFTSTIAADQELDSAVDLAFSGPMDQRSVAAALQVSPRTDVRLSWDPTGSRVTVSPAGRWQAGTFYTVTVRAGALGDSGRPMAVPARAVFLTRQMTTGRIAATAMAGDEAAVTTGFSFSFDRPVAIGEVRKALSVNPPLRGALDVARSADGSTTFVFTPADILQPATDYAVSLDGLVDASGAPVGDVPALSVRTTAAPAVVRFRPTHNTQDVARAQVLSVRFTQPMDRRSTKYAFTVTTGDSKPVSGKVSFAEKDTV